MGIQACNLYAHIPFMHFINTLYPDEFELAITGQKIGVFKLRDFFKLELELDNLRKGARDKNSDLFCKSAKNILALAKITNIDNTPKALLSILQIIGNNLLKAEVVFMKPDPNPTGKILEYSWNFKGRYLAQWIDILASRYGWSLEQICDLYPDTAVYLIQECLVNNHLDKEWEYNLSEVAYAYNKDTKQSEHKPLPKPHWMTTIDNTPIKRIKIRPGFVPGGVVNVSGYENLSRDEEKINVDLAKEETEARRSANDLR